MTSHLYESRVADTLWKVVPPILITIGTLGNLLCIVVLAGPRHRKTSTAVFLVTLAITDIVVLDTALLRQWLNYKFDVDVRLLAEALCKIHVFIVYSSIQYSSWILVLVTLERVLSVSFPHSVRLYCTRRKAVLAVLVVLLCVLTLNAYIMFDFGLHLIPEAGITLCIPTAGHRDFFFKIWPWIDFAVVFLLPFIILVTGNCVIIFKLRANYKFRKTSTCVSTNVSQRRPSSNVSHLSWMMLALNTSFLVFVSPVAVFSIGQVYWWPLDSTEQERATLDLLWAIFSMLMYSNNTINFVLYVLCGSKFRESVKQLLCCSREPGIHRYSTDRQISTTSTADRAASISGATSNNIATNGNRSYLNQHAFGNGCPQDSTTDL